MDYQTVIGLEVHTQLFTQSKIFCGCSTGFGAVPNSQTCPVCLGLPGALPVLNKKAFSFAVKVALALNCRISNFIKFDRKNYFYPDLPKNFQISQYDRPLSSDGYLDVDGKRIRITRVHLEEDAGKLIHAESGNYSLVDFNRSGMPLLEIVTEPEIDSPLLAYQYLIELKQILEYLKVSDCNMEEGSLRCDANLSLSLKKGELGVKTEVKNMNSFKGVQKALEYEVERQRDILDKGGTVAQETRLWDADKAVTLSMRSKEEAHDYRYFPEPDLVPFIIDAQEIEELKDSLPELPQQKKRRFAENYSLPEYDIEILTSDEEIADYFEKCMKLYNKPKPVSNWIMGEVLGQLKLRKTGLGELGLEPENLVDLLRLIEDGKISGKLAKEVFLEMVETGKPPSKIVEEKGLTQISDEGELAGLIDEIIRKNENAVNDYRKGKQEAIKFLVGQLMARTKGKANPAKANELLRKRLNNTGTEAQRHKGTKEKKCER